MQYCRPIAGMWCKRKVQYAVGCCLLYLFSDAMDHKVVDPKNSTDSAIVAYVKAGVVRLVGRIA